jgi:pyruvate/2-oxoglutarate dehydrogenase complex dihydrolipoamide dehydrogenase (E3) component
MIQTHTLVIGSGSGGITAAVTAAGFGKKVIMVDPQPPGRRVHLVGLRPQQGPDSPGP